MPLFNHFLECFWLLLPLCLLIYCVLLSRFQCHSTDSRIHLLRFCLRAADGAFCPDAVVVDCVDWSGESIIPWAAWNVYIIKLERWLLLIWIISLVSLVPLFLLFLHFMSLSLFEYLLIELVEFLLLLQRCWLEQTVWVIIVQLIFGWRMLGWLHLLSEGVDKMWVRKLFAWDLSVVEWLPHRLLATWQRRRHDLFIQLHQVHTGSWNMRTFARYRLRLVLVGIVAVLHIRTTKLYLYL